MKTLSLILIFTLTAINICSNSIYYYYDGKRVELTVDSTKLNIITTPDFRKESLRELSCNFIAMNSNRSLRNQSLFSGTIKIDNTLKYKDLIQTVRSNSEIICAAPYFRVNDSVSIGTSCYFYVKLKQLKDSLILQKLAKEQNVQVIGPNKFMPLWYCLSLTSKSQCNSVEMSNIFFESGFFEDVDPSFIFSFQPSCTNDTNFGQLWGLRNTANPNVDINVCEAWNITRGSGVTVAVLDQGIFLQHNDLSANILAISYDAQSGTSPSIFNNEIHGTHVAGTVAAIRNNSLQVVGVSPEAELLSVSHDMDPTTATIAEELADGINWAWQNGADVINNSWGDQGGDAPALHSILLENAISDALTLGRNNKGCVVVFASGNRSVMDYPAYVNSDILTVGAIDNTGQRSIFSQQNSSGFGNTLDVVAPGSDILSTTPNQNIGLISGTSMAAPHVSGIAALILSIRPDLTQAQVCQAIESTCQRVGGYSYTNNANHPNGLWNQEMGYGLVNAYAAVYSVAPRIDGPIDVYISQPATYSVVNVPSGTSVTWSITGGTIISGQGTNSVTISICSGASATLTATLSGTVNQVLNKVIESHKGEITVSTDINHFDITYTYPNATSYDWIVPATVTSNLGNGNINNTASNTIEIYPISHYGIDDVYVRAHNGNCVSEWNHVHIPLARATLNLNYCYLTPWRPEPFYATVADNAFDATTEPGEFFWYFDGELFECKNEGYIQSWDWPCGAHELTVTAIIQGVETISDIYAFDGTCYSPVSAWHPAYPNPVGDELVVERNEEYERGIPASAGMTKESAVTVQLFSKDQTTLVYSKTEPADVKQIRINTSKLKDGIYFLNIVEGKEKTAKQLVVVKH
jgi:hypothetical protein